MQNTKSEKSSSLKVKNSGRNHEKPWFLPLKYWINFFKKLFCNTPFIDAANSALYTYEYFELVDGQIARSISQRKESNFPIWEQQDSTQK